MLVDESKSLLVESPTYSGSLAALQPMTGKLVEIATDGHGLIPESMAEILSTWNTAKDGPKPKVS